MPIPENPSPQLSTVLKWFEHVDNWDIDGALKLTTDDFWLEAFPSPNGEHRMNKSEVIQYAETELASFTGAKSTILDVIEGKEWVVVHLKSITSPTDAVHEHTVTFHFVDEKIASLKMFLDASAAEELRSRGREP